MNDVVGQGLSHPSWTIVALIAAAVMLLGMPVAAYFVSDPRLERRLYWWGWLGGAALLASSLSDRGHEASLAALLGCAIAAVSFAFFKTSYLRVAGRTITLNSRRRHPDPPRRPSASP